MLEIIFIALLIPGYVIFGQETPAPSEFEQLLQQFDPARQTLAREIWNGIKPDTSSFKMAKEPISDSALVAQIRSADKENLLNILRGKRADLSHHYQKLHSLNLKIATWVQFIQKVEINTELGVVYLKALDIQSTLQSQLADQEKLLKKLESEITELRVNASLTEISLDFTMLDWVVIVFYLIFTTILGGLLAGKQATIKDFFLGGRKLPWGAVCGSIIATELSAATFLIAPAIVFSHGGDMTYIQLALGTIIARFIIGYFFIPAYYEREIYSPYDYMGNQLGNRVKKITSILFMVGGILAQGARVYIAAKALQVITGTDIAISIMIIGVAAILWTIMGGITTVIWTDTIQFLLFAFGAMVALFFAVKAIDGGLVAAIQQAGEAGKFNMLNLNFNPKEAYTLWCGLFATGFLTLGSHGTDQLMAQRMFTCKSQADARKAVIWSSASVGLTLLLLLVGAAVFVYYKHNPLSNPAQVIVNHDSMKVFAIYIVQVMPPMVSGLLMAALFSTAISTLDSILAALSQSTIDIIYKPYFKPDASDKHYVTASRIIVVIWGVFLAAFAIYCDTISKAFSDLIQFALAMAAYTYGALLGTFLLAFLPTRRDDLGLMWGVPLSMLLIFAFNWHQTVPQLIVTLACFILVVQAFRHLRENPAKIIYVGIASGLVLLVSMAILGKTLSGAPVYIELAWPWHFPIGAAMTFVMGYLIGNIKEKPGDITA
jgi:SSS family transporter